MAIPTDFRLRDVRVEPDRLRLSSPAGTVEVQPRVMDVIVALAADAHAVVSRQTLSERVWGPTQVGYHALARAIHQARKALAAVAPGHVFIETIPQRGYRLCVPRETVSASPSRRPPSWTPLADSMQRRIVLAFAGVLSLGLVMHAGDMHGSGIHLATAATILVVTVWHPSSWPRGARPKTNQP